MKKRHVYHSFSIAIIFFPLLGLFGGWINGRVHTSYESVYNTYHGTSKTVTYIIERSFNEGGFSEGVTNEDIERVLKSLTVIDALGERMEPPNIINRWLFISNIPFFLAFIYVGIIVIRKLANDPLV